MPIRLHLALSALDSATSPCTPAGQAFTVVLNVHPARKRQSLPYKVQVQNKKGLISIEYDLRLLAPTSTHVGRFPSAETIRRGRSRSLPGDLTCVRQRTGGTSLLDWS
jgi:hypothetical protein